MSLLDLLQEKLPWAGSRQRGRREAALRAFGKLPIEADFLPPLVGGDAGEWYMGWIENGRKNYPDYGPPVASRFWLLLAPVGESHAVVAVLKNSRDRKGREYPFTVFVTIPRSMISAAIPAAAHWLWATWQILEVAIETLAGVQDVGAYCSFCQNRAVVLPEPLKPAGLAALAEDWLEQPTVLWLQGILGERFRPRVLAFIEQTSKCIEMARTRPLGIRIPLGRTLSIAAQIDFWVDTHRLACGGNPVIPTLVFTPESSTITPYLSFVGRPPEPIDYLLLGPASSIPRFVENLGRIDLGREETDETKLDDWLQANQRLGQVRATLIRGEAR